MYRRELKFKNTLKINQTARAHTRAPVIKFDFQTEGSVTLWIA